MEKAATDRIEQQVRSVLPDGTIEGSGPWSTAMMRGSSRENGAADLH